MLEINVNVTSPDIVQAIGLLVTAIRGEVAPATKWIKEPQPSAPVTVPVTSAPIATPASQLAPAPAPATAPQPTQASAPQAPVAAAPSYTVAQVAKAGADLMAGNPALQPVLVELIHRYGAQTVQEIPQDKLGAFATEMRQMGAKI